MKERREPSLPQALERALHGDDRPRAASDGLRPPEEWEVVVAAVELALLGRECARPPALVRAKLARLLDSSHEPPR
jgi:hypothetical protein